METEKKLEQKTHAMLQSEIKNIMWILISIIFLIPLLLHSYNIFSGDTNFQKKKIKNCIQMKKNEKYWFYILKCSVKRKTNVSIVS